MAKRKTAQAAVSGDVVDPPLAERSKLSWTEEKFVNAYIDNGNNATQAYLTAHPGVTAKTASVEGSKTLAKPRINDAIESARTRMANLLDFSREKALRIYLGMALATIDDFTVVMKDPMNRQKYVGLNELKHAIESIEYTDNGPKIKLANKKAAVDELWTKLGFDKDSRPGDWFTGFERLAELIHGAKKKE